MNNITQRLITGIFFVGIIISAVVWNQFSFIALFSLITVLCIREYQQIIESRLSSSDGWKKAYKFINTTFALMIIGVVFLVAAKIIPMVYMSVVSMQWVYSISLFRSAQLVFWFLEVVATNTNTFCRFYFLHGPMTVGPI